MQFAKLFGPDDDQVLAVADYGDDGPEIRIYFLPHGLGLCNFALKFTHEDEDKAYSLRDSAFAEITEAKARDAVAAIVRDLNLDTSIVR